MNLKLSRFKKIILATVLILIFYPVNVYAMHIMEGFLPKEWSIIWWAIMIPFFIMGVKRLNKIFKYNPEKKMLIALVGAFVFVISSLKIPSVTGSSSHATGVGLGAILFGPTVMTVIGTIVLIFQALLLAHGGITTLGANAFSMAIVGPFVAFFVYKILAKNGAKSQVAIFSGAMLGDLMTYVVTAIQLGVAFPDPVGGVATSILKFLGIFALTQIPLAIGEGILTTIVYNLLTEYKKEAGVDEFVC